MTAICPAIRGLCRIRLTRLDSLGNVVDGSIGNDNSWVSKNMIQFGLSPEIVTGDSVELKNGCGDVIASFTDNDFRKRFNLTLSLGAFEPGLEEMLLGDDIVTDGGDPVGVSFADQTDPDFEPALVALEAWAKVIEGDAQSAVKPWLYILFPASFWQPGDTTVGADFWQPDFAGKTRSNPFWGDGPYGDLGITGGQIGALGGMVLIDEEPPTAECGYSYIAPGS